MSVAAAALVAGAVVAVAGRAALISSLPPRRPGPPDRRRPAPWHRHRPAPVEWASWCDDVARRSRAGASLRTSLHAASEGVQGLAGLTARLARGMPVADAFDDADADPDRTLVASTVGAVADLGGPVAPAFARTAAVLHARTAERAERTAASAQARLSARVLTVVPVAMLALLVTTDTAVRAAIATPLGWTCLVAGAAANAAGWWWMRRLIRAAS